jgi:hypothetical protein
VRFCAGGDGQPASLPRHNKLQTPSKMALRDIGKGYKNQSHNVSSFTLQAESIPVTSTIFLYRST